MDQAVVQQEQQPTHRRTQNGKLQNRILDDRYFRNGNRRI